MAYRRRQGLSRSSTFKEEIHRQPDQEDTTTSSAAPTHRHSLSTGAFHSSFNNRSKGSATYDYTSMRSTNEPGGFWGVLARKAKAILDDEVPQQSSAPSSPKPETIRFSTNNQFTGIQVQHQFESFDHSRKVDSPTIRMGLDRLKSSLNQIGNPLEEGKKTQVVIHETCKLQNRRDLNDEVNNQIQREYSKMQNSAQPQTKQETQLNASRDVAIATAAKVKQLLRELKTVKADLTFAKERCCQLQEENKLLREAHEKGDNPADDDMIRDQLEVLLAEKARLAHENSVCARENRYLREIVEFHQLSMQDVLFFDDEVSQVNNLLSDPNVSRTLYVSPPSPPTETSQIADQVLPSSSSSRPA